MSNERLRAEDIVEVFRTKGQRVWVTPLPRDGDSSGCPGSRPCWPLLDQPGVGFSSTRRLPDHLCDAMLWSSTAVWFNEQIRRVPDHRRPKPSSRLEQRTHAHDSEEGIVRLKGIVRDLSEAWFLPWPLPVGRKAARKAVWPWTDTGEWDTADVVARMPLLDAELAALAVRIPLDGGYLDLFGLVTVQDEPREWGSVEMYAPAGVDGRAAGTTAAFKQATEILKRAESWWSGAFERQYRPAPLGRPKRRATAIGDDWRRIAPEVKERRARGEGWKSIADAHGVPSRTLQRWLRWLNNETREV